MKDYESLTCLDIKQILKKKKVSGYSKLCKQELVKLLKKTLNNKKGGGGNNNNNNNNQSTSINLKKIVREKTAEFQKYMNGKLNTHQIERIMLLLTQCLHPGILKNKNEINIRREELLNTINTEIKQELYKTNTPNRIEIISKIIEFVEDILSSHANYRISLEPVNNSIE